VTPTLPLDDETMKWIQETFELVHRQPIESLLRRFNTEQQFDEALQFVRFRLAQNLGGQSIRDFLIIATRLVSVIGDRSLLSASVDDMRTVQNRKSWQVTTFRAGAYGPIRTKVTNEVTDKTRARQQREMMRFYTYHWTRPGTSSEEARRRAETLVRPPGLVSLGKPRRQGYHTLTPARAERLLKEIPGMRLSTMERIVHTAFVSWLIDNGSRSPSMLRCRVGNVERDADGIITGIQPPPGHKNKLTAPLVAGPHSASLEVLLTHHPAKDDPQAPLFFHPLRCATGEIVALEEGTLKKFLKRLGNAAELPFRLGFRCFRRLHHNEMAVNGDDDATMRTAHGHRIGSTTPSSYTRLDKDAALRAMRKIRGLAAKTPVCPTCLTTLALEDRRCPWCKNPVALPAVDEVAWGQDDYQRAEQAGRLGLDALQTIEGNEVTQ
jgi:hypothetical protein